MLMKKTFILSALAGAALCGASAQEITRDFADLEKKDWYEDLKHQQELVKKCEFKLELIKTMTMPEAGAPEAAFVQKERDAWQKLYADLVPIARKIVAEQKFSEYQKLKAEENQILELIDTQKGTDNVDAAEIRLKIGDHAAARLEIAQRLYE
jgi:hypothetical protein